MLEIGPYCIESVVTSRFRLDGGAMFGVVPKAMWRRTEDVDERNRILLTTRTLLAVNRAAGQAILIDTGPGQKWNAEELDRFAIESYPEALPVALGKFGLSVADVADIIVTHLHFDHNAGLTRWADAPGGDAAPCFPRARHWIHAGHLAHAQSPTERDRGSFYRRDFEAVDAAGLWQRVEGDDPQCPFECMEWFVSHGHTPYQLLPIFKSGNRTLLFTGDIIPTGTHCPPAWGMAYDLHPLTTMAEKKRILERCKTQGANLALPHDHRAGLFEVDFSGKHPRPKPLEDDLRA